MSDQPTPETPPANPKPKLRERIKAAIKKHPRRTWAIGITTAIAVIGGLVIGLTDLKYPVLGSVFKSTFVTTVIDQETNQPLAGATIKVGKLSATSGSNGELTLRGIHPGWQNLEVDKKAYQSEVLHYKLKFGQNFNSNTALLLTGIRLKFKVTNLITGEPLSAVTATDGAVESKGNNKGEVTLSLDDTGTKADLEIRLAGYVTKEFSVVPKRGLPVSEIKLVPVGKVYYLTNRSRRIDLMRANLDGSNEELILPGTGSEDSETGILPSVVNPSQIALVSSRDGRRDQNGNLRHDLFILDGDTHQLSKLDEDVAFSNLRSWVGNYLVYEINRPSTESIKSYEVHTRNSVELATVAGTDSYTSLTLVSGTNNVYYSVEDTADSAKSGLFVVSPSGQDRKRLSDTPAEQVVRQAKNSLSYNYYEGGKTVWRQLDLTNDQVTNLDHGPSTQDSRGYADSAGKNHSVFVEERDGKSELYLTDYDGGNEKRLTTGAKVGQFVQWYDDKYIVFSVTDGASSLYVTSIGGDKPVKIADFYRGNGRTYGGGYNPLY